MALRTALLCASVLLAAGVVGATSLSWPYGDRRGVDYNWQWRKGRATAFGQIGWVGRPLGCKAACRRVQHPEQLRHAASPLTAFLHAIAFCRSGWTIHYGSCMYNYIYQDEPLGWDVVSTGWDCCRPALLVLPHR